MNKGTTNELLLCALVPSTKASDMAHALTQLKVKRGIKVRKLYTDTCPNNKQFYQTVFGSPLTFKLFHLIQRMTKTVNRDTGRLFFECLNSLKNCLYTYSEEHEKRVHQALIEGKLGGRKFSEEEIYEMKMSSKWKRLGYDKYIPKIILQASQIKVNLRAWLQSFRERRDERGNKVFS